MYSYFLKWKIYYDFFLTRNVSVELDEGVIVSKLTVNVWVCSSYLYSEDVALVPSILTLPSIKVTKLVSIISVITGF